RSLFPAVDPAPPSFTKTSWPAGRAGTTRDASRPTSGSDTLESGGMATTRTHNTTDTTTPTTHAVFRAAAVAGKGRRSVRSVVERTRSMPTAISPATGTATAH